MAERRMFARSVIGSARFLKMPATARLLYYDLGMYADDDGIVEAFSTMRTTGASEDDLRVLVSRGFVRVLNEDYVSYILDWDKNNLIRKDRYHPSIYANLKNVECGVLLESEHEVTTNGQPLCNQRLTEVRLGKDSIGKDSIESVADKPPTRHKYGAYKNVLFTDEEYAKLQAEYPTDYSERIERLSEYIASTGKSYKSHLATIRSWARKDGAKAGTMPSYGGEENWSL